MTIQDHFFDVAAAAASVSPGPRHIPWPMPGNLGGLAAFNAFAEWQAFWLNFSLPHGVPSRAAQGYERAQKLYILAWSDWDLIIAGEMAALSTLDFVLKLQYGQKETKRRKDIIAKAPLGKNNEPSKRQKKWAEEPYFADLLKYMIAFDELTDSKIGLIKRTGGSVEALLLGDRKPSLTDMRNGRMHGNPFESSFQAGLLELVRDLIVYAYRDRVAEASRLFPNGPPMTEDWSTVTKSVPCLPQFSYVS